MVRDGFFKKMVTKICLVKTLIFYLKYSIKNLSFVEMTT